MFTITRIDGVSHTIVYAIDRDDAPVSLGRDHCFSREGVPDKRVSTVAASLHVRGDSVVVEPKARNPIYVLRAAVASQLGSGWIAAALAGSGGGPAPHGCVALQQHKAEHLYDGDILLLQPHRFFFLCNRIVFEPAPPPAAAVAAAAADANTLVESDDADIVEVHPEAAGAREADTVESLQQAGDSAATRPESQQATVSVAEEDAALGASCAAVYVPGPPALKSDDDASSWLWCLEHGVSSVAELYALSDDASRYGLRGDELPLPCPWTYEQIMAVARNHLQLYPFLELAVQPEAQMREARTRLLAASQLKGASSSSIEASSLRKRRAPSDDAESGSQVIGIGAPAHSGAGVNLNRHLTDPLHILERAYKFTQVDIEGAASGLAEKKRHMLEHAIGVLSYLPFKVTRVEQIDSIPFCSGKETRDKLAEILRTGSLKRAEMISADVRIQTLIQFGDVLWAGPVVARRWHDDLRLTSVDSLRQAVKERGASIANVRQRLGLDLFDDLRVRIQRSEAEAVREIIAAEVADILPGALCVLGGSFRRGQPSSGDLDIILCVPSGYGVSDLLPALYRRLRARRWLKHDLRISWGPEPATTDTLPVDDLSIPDELSPRRDRTADTATSYFGIWRFESPPHSGPPVQPALQAAIERHSAAALVGIHRRIDMCCFAAGYFALSMHAWTGNTILNRCLNIYANLLGKSEIAAALQSSQPSTIKGQFRSDFDIYSYLGLKYIRPVNRCIWGGFSEAGIASRAPPRAAMRD